jgi:cytoskeletal protein CcmA (bactofilin family)
LAFVGIASATNFKTGNDITVAANETVDGMLFTAGNNIDIAGTVNGDVYCAGQSVVITGTVKGDVFCAGQTVMINGVIEGSVRIAGQSVTLDGIIENSATVAAQNFTISKSGSVGRDLLGGSQNLVINGRVLRDVEAGSQDLTVNGTVGRDINGSVNTLSIGSAGQVTGNVDYVGTSDPSIAAGGKILGTTHRTVPKNNIKQNSYSPAMLAIFGFVIMFIAFVVTALLLAKCLRGAMVEATKATMKSPIMTILVGAAAMLIVPIFIIVLFMTVIGIPLAIITILVWLLVMALSGPFVSFLLGRLLMRGDKHPCWGTFLGASILVILYFIPIIGFIAMLLTSMFGIGMLLRQGRKMLMAKA